MTWEETIQYIRKEPAYQELVEKAYFEEELSLNVERFKNSAEFKETLKLIEQYHPTTKTILDIGCGNGISSIAFALAGFHVTAVEPDPSDTIGAGAIRKLKEHYKLDNIAVFEAFAEDIAFPESSFDLVYVRQAMHHANDLEKFIGESGRVLKPKGILLTIRDHVVFSPEDKSKFLANHPLHKFYGGENAFSPEEYKAAMQKAGLNVLAELKSYDSIINFFPATQAEIDKKRRLKDFYQQTLKPIHFFIPKRVSTYFNNILNENSMPGRMYSYVATKI